MVGAKDEINVDEICRGNIFEAVTRKQYTPSLFDEAQKKVYANMRLDALPKFLQSEDYKQYVSKGGSRNLEEKKRMMKQDDGKQKRNIMRMFIRDKSFDKSAIRASSPEVSEGGSRTRQGAGRTMSPEHVRQAPLSPEIKPLASPPSISSAALSPPKGRFKDDPAPLSPPRGLKSSGAIRIKPEKPMGKPSQPPPTLPPTKAFLEASSASASLPSKSNDSLQFGEEFYNSGGDIHSYDPEEEYAEFRRPGQVSGKASENLVLPVPASLSPPTLAPIAVPVAQPEAIPPSSSAPPAPSAPSTLPPSITFWKASGVPVFNYSDIIVRNPNGISLKCPTEEFVWKVTVPSGTMAWENASNTGGPQVWTVVEGHGVATFSHTGRMVCLELGDTVFLNEEGRISLLTSPNGSLVLLCHRLK